MPTPQIITYEELRSGIGIGASEIAAILHLSPYQSAFQLWQTKTGRIPKPPATEAMEYGNKMEPVAFAQYLERTGHSDMQRQVAAVHPTLPFLRAIADGWDGKHGVEIKCPTSRRLVKSVRKGTVPTHYALQVACMMDIFGVNAWDFFVYDTDKSELLPVKWTDAILKGNWSTSLGYDLKNYWRVRAIPQIEAFWARVCADAWEQDGQAEVQTDRWKAAIEKRRDAKENIELYEEMEMEANAELKQMVGTSRSASADGWRASWTNFKPTWGVSISVTSEATQKQIVDALDAIKDLEGVKEIKAEHQPNRRVFKIAEVKGD